MNNVYIELQGPACQFVTHTGLGNGTKRGRVAGNHGNGSRGTDRRPIDTFSETKAPVGAVRTRGAWIGTGGWTDKGIAVTTAPRVGKTGVVSPSSAMGGVMYRLCRGTHSIVAWGKCGVY